MQKAAYLFLAVPDSDEIEAFVPGPLGPDFSFGWGRAELQVAVRLARLLVRVEFGSWSLAMLFDSLPAALFAFPDVLLGYH